MITIKRAFDTSNKYYLLTYLLTGSSSIYCIVASAKVNCGPFG